MTRPYIPFLVFLILLVFTIPISFDFGTSVVPGWHTTILAPYFVWELVVVVVLLFGTVGYWLLSKRVDKMNWTLFAIHFIMTIPTVIFLKFPSILLNVQDTSQNDVIKGLAFRIKLIPVAWAIFIFGQLLFLVYYIRTIKENRISK